MGRPYRCHPQSRRLGSWKCVILGLILRRGIRAVYPLFPSISNSFAITCPRTCADCFLNLLLDVLCLFNFRDNAVDLRGYGSRNKSTAVDLLAQFIRFLAIEYDFESHVGCSIPFDAEYAHFAISLQATIFQKNHLC